MVHLAVQVRVEVIVRVIEDRLHLPIEIRVEFVVRVLRFRSRVKERVHRSVQVRVERVVRGGVHVAFEVHDEVSGGHCEVTSEVTEGSDVRLEEGVQERSPGRYQDRVR